MFKGMDLKDAFLYVNVRPKVKNFFCCMERKTLLMESFALLFKVFSGNIELNSKTNSHFPSWQEI